jgi:hypothetical protein
MVIAGHTGKIPQFWLEILNPLKIWVQKIYRPAHLTSLWVNLILGSEHWNSYNMCYKPDIKIPILDPESTHQIGPNYIWIKSFGRGHLMSFPWWLETRRGLGDLFQFVSLNLHLDLNFEENPYLIREIWNSHHSSWCGKINDGGWNEDQVTFSDLFCSTCI